MSQTLKLRRSSVPGKVPTTSSIEIGEIALNTYDGLIYMKKSGSGGEEVVAIGRTSGSFSGSFSGNFSGSLQGTASYAQTSSYSENIKGGKATYLPYFNTNTTLATSSIYQSGSTSIIINQANNTEANPEALYVWQPHPTSINVISGKGNLNNYLQLNIHNTNQGGNSSSDVVATADNGNETVNYIDMGINGENFSGSIGGPNDAYLYSAGKDLHIGNVSNYAVQIFAGGVDVESNKKLILNPNNSHELTGSLKISEALTVVGGITASLQGTSSYALNAKNAITSSYSYTASYALNAGVSIDTASLATTGSNMFYGNQTISGSNDPTTVFTIHQPSDDPWAFGIYNDSYSPSQFVIAGYVENSGRALIGTEIDTPLEFYVNANYGSPTLAISSSAITVNGDIHIPETSEMFGTASYARNADASTSSSYAEEANNAQTASYAPLYLPLTGGSLSGDLTVSQNLYVVGTASINVIQYVSQSTLNIGTNIITVNTSTPATRFGGIAVYDSGSTATGLTGSLLWDSENNHWVYSNPSGSEYDGAMLISGPKNTSGLGNETGLTLNYLTVAVGEDHIGPSSIYHSGSITVVTGSLTVTQGVTGSLLGTSSYALNSSNATSASYSNVALSSSNALSSSYSNLSQTSSYALTASYAMNGGGGGTGAGFPFTGSAIITGSLIVTGSITSTGGVSGSLFGTASWASNAITSSYVLGTVDNAVNAQSGSNFVVTSTLRVDGALMDYSTVNSTIVGSNNMFTIATGSYTSAFVKYTVAKTTSARSGEITVVWNGTTAMYTDTSTTDIGNTADVVMSAAVVGTDIQVNAATGTSGWKIKSFATFM